MSNEMTDYKFTKFGNDGQSVEYTFICNQKSSNSAFNFKAFTGGDTDIVIKYNAILRTMPKYVLYEACLQGIPVALRIRDRVAKGDMIHETDL